MSKKSAMTSWSHEVYKWPALMPLFDKPIQPPTRTVLRFFRPEPDESLCKSHYAYAENPELSDRSKKIEKIDDSVLMDRDESIKKTRKLKKSFKDEKFRSTYQVGYGAMEQSTIITPFFLFMLPDDLTYEGVINRVRKKSAKRASKKMHEAKSQRPDPFPFRKTLDKRVILTDYPSKID
ncbi:hypothetical protein QAD02_014761 [Eretmocerus hayati]|uniref:Uncharacterized protein n=1 Tax=Eretmocerus hayati TaxID=131215 RepID=A0ACC2P6S0_9HYME|nr:hypothetical protein QAD02_014761 [Eretmocerus hayati]